MTTTLPNPDVGGRRIKYLDALRGIAATYVVLFHLIFVGPVAPPAWFRGFAVAGASGVMLFFVISCFSLFYTMPARLKEQNPTLSFYIHRFFRIVPLFYFWLFLACLRNEYVNNIHNTPLVIIQNALMIFNLVPGLQDGIAPASWTIGVEVLFYAIFPLIYLFVKDLKRSILFFIASIIFYVLAYKIIGQLHTDEGVKYNYQFWFFTKDIPVFACGAICYFLIFKQKTALTQSMRKGLVGFMMLLSLAIFVAKEKSWITDAVFFGNPYIWHGIAYSFLLYGVSLYQPAILVNRITSFLGKISYSLYLSHATVIASSHKIYEKIGLYIHNEAGYYFTCLATTLAIAIPFSYITYKLIELPFIKIGESFHNMMIKPRITINP